MHHMELNLANVARGCHVNRKTVEGYLEVLEDLLLAFCVPVFTRRAQRELAFSGANWTRIRWQAIHHFLLIKRRCARPFGHFVTQRCHIILDTVLLNIFIWSQYRYNRVFENTGGDAHKFATQQPFGHARDRIQDNL